MVLCLAAILKPVWGSTGCMQDCKGIGQTCGNHACCKGMGTTCGDDSECTGMETHCGARSLCSGVGSQCGAGSICSGMSSVCGPGSQCTGLGAQCTDSQPMPAMPPMPPMPSMTPMPTMPPMPPMPTMPSMEPVQVPSPSKVYSHGCDTGSSCAGRSSVSQVDGLQYCCPANCPDCAMSASQTDSVLTVTCVCRKSQSIGLFSAKEPMTGFQAVDRSLWAKTGALVAVSVAGASLIAIACKFSLTFRRSNLWGFQGWCPQEGQQSLLA